MSKCDFILSTGERLDYNQMREHLLDNYSALLAKELKKATPPTIPPTPPSSNVTEGRLNNSYEKARKSFQNVINRSTSITPQQRKLLQDSPNRFYTTVSTETTKQSAKAIIDDIGIENAEELANSERISLLGEDAALRIMLLGAVANYYSEQAQKAYNQRNEKGINEASESELNNYERYMKTMGDLAKYGTNLGRAIAAFKGIYEMSGFALVKKLERLVQESNEGFSKEEVDKTIDKIVKELEEKNKAAIEKVKAEAYEQIESIYAKMPTKKRDKVDTLLASLANLKKKLRGRAYDATLGIPVAILDAGITTIEYALKAGVAISDAIELGINKIKKDFPSFDKDKELRKMLSDVLGEEAADISAEMKKLGIKNKTLKGILKEYIKTGEWNSEKVKEILLKSANITSVSKEDEQEIQKLSESIVNKETPYYIAAQAKERVQFIFDSYGKNLDYYAIKDFTSANQLTGIFNQIQNSTGFFRVVNSLIDTAITSKSPINAARVFAREFIKAKAEASTILFRGRVSRGASYEDLLGNTGEQRTRYLEYMSSKGFFKKIIVGSKIKYINRLLEAADTFSSAVSAGLSEFNQATKYIDRFYPNLSKEERAEKVWAIMYNVEDNSFEEREKAIKDLKQAGVENPTQSEINRTIYERATRKRDERLKEEYAKVTDNYRQLAEKAITDRGETPTTESVQEEIDLMFGNYDSRGIVAKGQLQAQRETGKLSTYGLTSLITIPIEQANRYIGQQIRTTKSSAIRGFLIGTETVTSKLFPFATSIARWTEMQLELTPYGLLKGASYKVFAIAEKNKQAKEELSQDGGIYLRRSVIGAAEMAMLYGILSSLKSDDDDDDETARGIFASESYAREKVAGVGKPKQSAKIGEDRRLPLSLLGNLGIAYGWYADYYQRYKKESKENKIKGVLIASAASTFAMALESSWYQSYSRYSSIGADIFDEKNQNKLGTITGRIAGTLIPWNRFQNEIGQVMNPSSEVQDNFYINILNQFSIVRGIGLNQNKNFDYRGREYDTGDIYVNSLDGLVKLMTGKIYRDDIDNFLSNINFAASDPYRQTKSDELTTYSVFNKEDLKPRVMTNEEWYDFRKTTATLFNEKVTENWKYIDESINKLNLSDDEKILEKRLLVGSLMTQSRKEAILGVNKKLGLSEKQIDKIKDKEEMKNAKKDDKIQRIEDKMAKGRW